LPRGAAGSGAVVATGAPPEPSGATTVAPGPANTRFTFKLVVRLDNDARVQLARHHLLDVEPIGIVLEGDPRHIQAIPIDEVVVQRIVDRVQTRDADIAVRTRVRVSLGR